MIKIYKYGEVENSKIFDRTLPTDSVADIVRDIVDNVRQRGDEALFEYTKKLDGADLTSLAVSKKEIDEAMETVDADFLEIIKNAAENIKSFHEKQLRTDYVINKSDGIVLGQRILPVEKAGIYVPGGTAAYPSTVLMNAIPAKIAGVGEIIMVTPPGKDGSIAPAILAAASIAGVDKIFKLGGAQAVAALAYGTQSVPKVDKIVGPGNAYVAEAKRQVYGKVSIDMIAGPSEILVAADSKSDPSYVAADLLSQAEHDRMASAVLVTDSQELAEAVAKELEIQLEKLPRQEIARASIENNGKIIIADNIEKVIEIANEIAPEHLELIVDNPFDYLGKIKHAGSVFLGRNCPEALGDYYAGPNHTLPTGGTARFSSPLGVDDFVKRSQYIYYTKDALEDAAADVARFAGEEGLMGHARSALIRTEKNE